MTLSKSNEKEQKIFRTNGISYVDIPTNDARRSAEFYRAVFGWSLNGNPDCPGFEDGSGHVIGHWKTDIPIAGAAGVVLYIYVESVDITIVKITANGGKIEKTPYPKGDLWVATFQDPAGNMLGIWQSDRRS
jgi:uncharacterized protein